VIAVKGHSRFVRRGDLEATYKKRLRPLGLSQAPSLPAHVRETAPLINYPGDDMLQKVHFFFFDY
jgi:hypothetical protein